MKAKTICPVCKKEKITTCLPCIKGCSLVCNHGKKGERGEIIDDNVRWEIIKEKEKVFIINSLGEKLEGIRNQPNNPDGKTAILVHGFGVTKEEGGMFDEMAGELNKQDIIVFRFDFAGRGESEGDYSEVTLTKLKDDLGKIVDFVKSQEGVDKNRIGLLGQSFGTATIVALQPVVKTIILTSSIAQLEKVFVDIFGKDYNPEGISKKMRSSGEIINVKPEFWLDFHKYNLLSNIKNIKCPILFIHGDKDSKVPLSEMELYYENANEPKEKVILADADHGFRPHRDKLYVLVASWFSEKL